MKKNLAWSFYHALTNLWQQNLPDSELLPVQSISTFGNVLTGGPKQTIIQSERDFGVTWCEACFHAISTFHDSWLPGIDCLQKHGLNIF